MNNQKEREDKKLILEAQGMCYNDKEGEPVLDDIELRCQEGAFYLIEGDNGAGKTTLIKCLTCLLVPAVTSRNDRKSYLKWHNGRELVTVWESGKRKKTKNIADIRSRRFGIFLHEECMGLVPYLTPIANIELPVKINPGLKDHNNPCIKTFVDRIIKKLEPDKNHEKLKRDKNYKKTASQLSTGWQQIVSLTRMLTTDPKIIFADEPFSAMDKHFRKLFLETLIELATDYDKTVILVSHDDLDIDKQMGKKNVGKIPPIYSYRLENKKLTLGTWK